MDDKVSVLGILEAVEMLLNEGFKPGRTLYLVFGHDEEVGGKRGSMEIVQLLRSRGVELEYVLDEGMVVTQGIIPGIEKPFAAIGIAEKGFDLIEALWQTTLKAITECPCQEGCPSCVQSPKCGNNNQPLDKKAAQILLEGLLSR